MHLRRRRAHHRRRRGMHLRRWRTLHVWRHPGLGHRPHEGLDRRLRHARVLDSRALNGRRLRALRPWGARGDQA
ncbi:MAG: hypothetical protein J0H91_07190, partial [Rhodospirillales bacterium]|nr:hypothetical protein [Rhodospirillales bacterium]